MSSVKPLTFTRKEELDFPVDMRFLKKIVDSRMPNKQAAQVLMSSRPDALRIGDIFKVSGKDHQNIVIENSSFRLEGIGTGWNHGKIKVIGNAGSFTAQSLRGGCVHVEGSVGDFSGCGLKGGQLLIDADAGNGLGASLPGEKIGMNEGRIIVNGNAGSRLGNRMRRGIIAVYGEVGIGACSSMISGTVLLLGGQANLPGTHMRRGTIICASEPNLSADSFFEQVCEDNTYWNIFCSYMEGCNASISQTLLPRSPRKRFVGELKTYGMGESFGS
ncbi:MAG: formylmethanofuran dehydrogenase subunit C, partial [Gammaproteobacteria bacterium]|nr:formylmethanofuran dehydrogenase subunit C [Gammaproteobacteria bacterium]